MRLLTFFFFLLLRPLCFPAGRLGGCFTPASLSLTGSAPRCGPRCCPRTALGGGAPVNGGGGGGKDLTRPSKGYDSVGAEAGVGLKASPVRMVYDRHQAFPAWVVRYRPPPPP